MKKQITRAFAILGLLLGLAATSSQTFAAQATGRLVFDVPFEFVAGDETLPAGRYIVTRVARDSARALLIRREDGRASVTVLTNTAEAGGELPRVSFKRYGERYFLSLVSAPGGEAARSLPASSMEKQLRRELAKAKKTKGGAANVAETVTVSAGLR
jgi:hypothetical protein